MGGMSTTWRALTPDDVPAVTALFNTGAVADGTGETAPEGVVAEMFAMPRFDPATDTVGVWQEADLVGAGFVLVRDHLVDGRAMVSPQGVIHPDRRGEGLGAQLLSRLEERGIELARGRLPGAAVRLRTSGGLPGSSAQRLLEQCGYLLGNYFLAMEVNLASWADPGGPTGAVVPRPGWSGPTREAHNDAFRDHRNSSPISEDHWAHWLGSSAYREGLSRLVVDGDRVLAYVLASEYAPGTVHIDLVGTRREARGRGLAKDVLVAALRAAREAGLRTSELEVDSTSPTGADRLYTSIGYRTVRVISRYQRDVPADGADGADGRAPAGSGAGRPAPA